MKPSKRILKIVNQLKQIDGKEVDNKLHAYESIAIAQFLDERYEQQKNKNNSI